MTSELARSSPTSLSFRRWLTHRDVWGCAVLLTATLALFLPTLLTGGLWVAGDLEASYWPTMALVYGALREGRLLLWTPHLLGGFPIFADGSHGLLFPINWVLLVWPTGYMLVPLLRTLLAALGMYLLTRRLGVGAAGATLAGLVFALNGSNTSHFSHIDLMNGWAMLPFALLMAEQSYRARTWRGRMGWLVGATVVMGLAWGSPHPMAPLMILPVYGGWVAYRGLLTRDEAGAVGWRSRIGWVAAALVIPGVLGVGLSAVQTLPTLELAAESPRLIRDPYFNASYSLPPYELLALLWPTFFHSAHDGVQWSLWNLETLVYLGTLPLALVLVAWTLRPRGYHLAFFTVVGLLALWVALGLYPPLSLQQFLYDLPGYSVLRTPARFFYLTAFCGAYLAGVGLHGLFRPDLAPAARRHLKALIIALAVVAALMPVLAVVGMWWIEANPDVAARLIQSYYLDLPRLTLLHVDDVVNALREKLRPTNPELWRSVGWLLVSAALLVLAVWRRVNRRLLIGVMVALSAVELVYLATLFVAVEPLHDFVNPAAPAQHLLETLHGERYYTLVEDDNKASIHNSMFGLSDLNGQSSLYTARWSDYTSLVRRTETRLLDVANVRAIWSPKTVLAGERSRFNVRFNVLHPMTEVDAATPPLLATFDAQGQATRCIRLLLALKQGGGLPRETEVGRLLVTSGPRVTIVPLRAGVEIGANVARASSKRTESGETDPMVERQISYTEQCLTTDGPLVTIDRLEFQASRPDVVLQVYGIGLRGTERADVRSLDRFSLARYTLIYEDDSARLFRSASTLPRAYLVGQAVQWDDRRAALDRLGQPGFDVTRRITLEGAAPVEAAGLIVAGPSDPKAALPAAPDTAALGEVNVAAYTDMDVTLQATTQAPAFLVLADAFFPRWVARVDGQETPILRANTFFRAVYLPPGAHTVTFSYEPRSVRLGFLISALTWAALVVGVVWLWRTK